MKTFADRIRHARQLRQLSQQELARASGLAQSTISSYENQSRASTTRLMALAEALQVNPRWLDTGKGPKALEDTLSGPVSITRHDLREGPDEPPGYVWPFARTSPTQFWALSATDRQLLEDVLAMMVSHLSKSDKQR